MNSKHAGSFPGFLLALAFLAPPAATAHEAANLNDYGVQRMNDTIAAKVLEAQVLMSEYFQRRRKPEQWPDQDLTRLESDLKHLKEDADMSLEYLLGQGVNIQDPAALKANPIAGGAVAGSQAVNTAISMVQHAASLDSQDAFVKEIYGQGLSAYMYNLVGAYREKMDLYDALLKAAGDGSDEPKQDGET